MKPVAGCYARHAARYGRERSESCFVAPALNWLRSKEMADDKSEIGGPDRRRVAADEPYEVEHFASKFGLSADEARELISRFGNDRATLEREAERKRLH
jgi:hypothetical protein